MAVKVFLVVNLIICYSIANTFGVCQIRFPPDDQTVRPMLVKKIGSRQVNIRNKHEYITLQDGEELIAKCDTGFISPSYDATSLDFYCNNDGLYLNGNYYSRDLFVECDSLKWNLYESSTPFSWCPPPMEPYTLARPSGDGGFQVLAGICYNFENTSVQSMHYVVAPKSSKQLSQSRFHEYTPSKKIQNVPAAFIFQTIASSMYYNSQIKNWIEFSKYEYQSLIQHSDSYKESNIQLGGMLDIAWWSGLRLGNWQLYEEALNQHIEAETLEYDIIAGISGTVSAPIYKESCHTNRTMVEIVDDADRKMPLYVWHYLKSTRNQSENFVVIGVNSPFYEFYTDKDLVFCNDICPQIEWLQKVHSTFYYKAMGVIFCCSVDDVRAANRLNNFPKPITTTPPPVTTPLPYSSEKLYSIPVEDDY